MSIIQKSLTTDMLPADLDDRQRFLTFAGLFEHYSNTGELDAAEDVPFRAAMNAIEIGTTLVGRCDGTFTTVRRELRQIRASNDDRYCLARNVGPRAARVTHRGRECLIRPGSMVLLKLDEPFLSVDGFNHKRFTNIHLPQAGLRGMVPEIDDLICRELAPGGVLSLAMDYSDLLLDHPATAEQAGVAIAAHLMDLAALGLGAHVDAKDRAQRGGLRAIRLDGLLRLIERHFASPDFSAQKLARLTGLSERYVHELLYEAGAGFTARVLELRLRRAAALLARSEPKRISEIAFACGFNDLSYFNRCFRRRFGMTPTAARGR